MNPTNDGWGCEQEDQAAAFALGALEVVEGRDFELHLSECARCRGEVARMQRTVSALATSTPRLRASEGLRDRVMGQVRAEAELFKAAGADADRAPARRRRRPRRLAALAGSAAMACGVAVGAVVIGAGSGAPNRQTISAAVASTASEARAELVRTGAQAELVVAGIEAPPPGRIYQVWLAGDRGAPRPTDALFSVNQAGAGTIDVPGDLHGIKRVMVTAEPLGGSSHPTSPPIIVATLS